MFAWCAALRAQQHDVDGLQVREQGQVGEGGFSTIWRVHLVADRGPDDERLPTTMALKKTICQDEERLDLARNEVELLKRASSEGRHAGREFLVQYFSHKELACQKGGNAMTEVQLLMEWCGGGSLLSRILGPETVAIARCPNMPEAEGLDCNWHSYEEVGMSSRALAEGLREVVDGMGPSVILGLLSAVSEEWFLTDFACTLAGLPLVTMHRSTDEKTLAQILEQTKMSVLILSQHLRPVLLGAQRLIPSPLRRVIWIEDAPDPYGRWRAASVALAPAPDAPGGGAWRSERWSAVLARGAAAPLGAAVRREEGFVLKLLPSSGSTGKPKLVPVTEKMLFQGGTAAVQCSVEVVVYAYEAFRQSHQVLLQGGRIGAFSGRLGDGLLRDAHTLRPTAFAAPPAV
ncbi:unnamed protein product [Durusdinium trenchii]|uniref:AMP-dependent synthetase/ligase domain-containing protein n=1 Tax=Durusdinium trenchii TaxID=1381693 RepID=A0ABP0L0P7_9DINO